MLVQISQTATAAARSLACEEMPDLIVRHFLRDLPDQISRDVDAHLKDCPRCMGRRQALAIAADHHAARRLRGLAGPTSGSPAS